MVLALDVLVGKHGEKQFQYSNYIAVSKKPCILYGGTRRRL